MVWMAGMTFVVGIFALYLLTAAVVIGGLVKFAMWVWS